MQVAFELAQEVAAQDVKRLFLVSPKAEAMKRTRDVGVTRSAASAPNPVRYWVTSWPSK